MPDVTVYLDLPVDQGLERKRSALARHSLVSPLSPPIDPTTLPEWNRLDAREIAFHERVRQGYGALIAAEPDRWLSFDGNLDRDTLAAAIWERLEPLVIASTKRVKV